MPADTHSDTTPERATSTPATRAPADMSDSERLDLAYRTIDQLRAETVRYRRALDNVHSRLEHAGAYRTGAYLHSLWREVDAALGNPGRRR